MLARFSTVAGEQGSADTVRDPRGFSLKYYTSEGNYDLVGNNTPIFFVRDTMKFPHFIRSQVMPYDDAKTYRVKPFDLTKVWSHEDYPLIKVGTMTLNRNPENFFAQIEQAAFEPSAVVPGIGFSPDKMLLGRVFAYGDTHRYRIGPNYLQLPVNRPKVPVNSYEFDGPMRYEFNPGQPVYSPNTEGGPAVHADLFAGHSWESDSDMVRTAYTLRPRGRRLQPGQRPGEQGDRSRPARPPGGDDRLDPGHRPSRHQGASVRLLAQRGQDRGGTPSPS
jgi:catalase